MKRLLLHTCCAPCSIAVIDELKSKFDLTVFFYNPNIFPEEEYIKRKGEVVRVCKEWNIPFVDADYEPAVWETIVAGLEHEPEMGERCPVCINMRLRRTAEFAAQNNINFFSTTLSSGRNKNADLINKIGANLVTEYNIKFLAEDWKKSGRQEKSKKMVSERGIYRQNYCGCKYSLRDRI